jgi:hypothetical protein
MSYQHPAAIIFIATKKKKKSKPESGFGEAL